MTQSQPTNHHSNPTSFRRSAWRRFGRPTALAFAFAALVAPLALAGPNGGRGGPGGGHRGGPGMRGADLGQILYRLADRLEMTEEQRDSVRQILEENREDLRAAGQAVREQHNALRQAAQSDPVDEGAVQLAGDALGDAAADAALARARVHQELLDILTPEQRAALEDLKAEREMRREERRQRREERRGGSPDA